MSEFYKYRAGWIETSIQGPEVVVVAAVIVVVIIFAAVVIAVVVGDAYTQLGVL